MNVCNSILSGLFGLGGDVHATECCSTFIYNPFQSKAAHCDEQEITA